MELTPYSSIIIEDGVLDIHGLEFRQIVFNEVGK